MVIPLRSLSIGIREYDSDKQDRLILGRRRKVMDIVYIGITVVMCVLSWLFVKLAEKVQV